MTLVPMSVILAAVLAARSERLEIALKPQAFVDRLVFTIQDVADVLPPDHALRQDVLEIALGPAPRPKYPRTVTASAILFALQDHGIELGAVRVGGAAECLVQVRPVSIKGSDIV